MSESRLLRVLTLTALIVTLCGCAAYSVVVRNHSERRIVDSAAVLNGEETVTGRLGAGAGKMHAFFARKVPKQAEVWWVWEDDVEKRVIVPLKGTVPRVFRGDIVFVINADATVTVRTRK